jgi:uncharacterized coiled-coil protein SlyX
MTDAHDPDVTLKLDALEEDKQQLQETVVTSVENTETTGKGETELSDAERKDAAPTLMKSKAEVIERLKEVAQNPNLVERAELEALKQAFYKLHHAEQETALKTYVEEGGKEEDYVPQPDPLEEEYKTLMGEIKKERSALNAEQERLNEENLQKKSELIERLRELVDSADDANKSYPEFKQLQQQWNELKVPASTKANELWKAYQVYAEKFYDLLKLNNEFREYDFKKNLAIKTRLCEAAERLSDESDVVSAFHQLQRLHQEFRETGPVAKELREELWARFKAASTLINRRHQAHFDKIKEMEQHNLDQKTVICEIVEAMEYDQLKTFADWEEKTQEILALQAKWKTIGFAPQKMNVKIFERFRADCDEFFRRKGEFFKSVKASLSENLAKKRALCEKAEALKDSTDWKATAEVLTALQKEWKTVGPVSKKHSDSVWKRFITACDYFFDQKAKATSSVHSAEVENLERKRAITAQLTAINEAGPTEENAAQVQELAKEWNSIGHVPFKEKDKAYKEFHAIVDELFAKLRLSDGKRRPGRFKQGGKGKGGDEGNSVIREREKLLRTYEGLKSDIQNYENNLGFLSSSSEKGSSLVTEMKKKVEKLRGDMEAVLQKIQALDNTIAPAEEETPAEE